MTGSKSNHFDIVNRAYQRALRAKRSLVVAARENGFDDDNDGIILTQTLPYISCFESLNYRITILLSLELFVRQYILRRPQFVAAAAAVQAVGV